VRGIVAWGDPAPEDRSPAQRFAELAPLATGRDGTIAPDDLELLARLSESCEILRIPHADTRELLATLRDISDERSR
jgi:hypothetical protein